MGDALVSEFLIALFALIVAVLTFRRHTPRSVELLAWGGLIWVCIMGVTGTHEAHARALTAAAVWGASQTIGTFASLASQGAMQWIFERRFYSVSTCSCSSCSRRAVRAPAGSLGSGSATGWSCRGRAGLSLRA